MNYESVNQVNSQHELHTKYDSDRCEKSFV